MEDVTVVNLPTLTTNIERPRREDCDRKATTIK
jgi:hypothetical protein